MDILDFIIDMYDSAFKYGTPMGIPERMYDLTQGMPEERPYGGILKSPREFRDPIYEDWVDPVLNSGIDISQIGNIAGPAGLIYTQFQDLPPEELFSDRTKAAVAAKSAAESGGIDVRERIKKLVEDRRRLRSGEYMQGTPTDALPPVIPPDLPSAGNLYQDLGIQFEGMTPEKLERIRQQAASHPDWSAASGRNSGYWGPSSPKSEGLMTEVRNLGPEQTDEALRRYVAEAKGRELDTQISLIEQAYPAAQRSPEANAAIEALYARKAALLQGQADVMQAAALGDYYADTTDAQMYGHQARIQSAAIEASGDIQAKQLENYKYLFDALAKDPNGPSIAQWIIQILNGPGTQEEKDQRIAILLKQTGAGELLQPSINGLPGSDDEERAKLAELFGQPW